MGLESRACVLHWWVPIQRPAKGTLPGTGKERARDWHVHFGCVYCNVLLLRYFPTQNRTSFYSLKFRHLHQLQQQYSLQLLGKRLCKISLNIYTHALLCQKNEFRLALVPFPSHPFNITFLSLRDTMS